MKLTALTSPSGFGKTPIMQQWAKAASSNGADTLWHSVMPEQGALNALLYKIAERIGDEQATNACRRGSIQSVIDASHQMTGRIFVFIDNIENLASDRDIQCLIDFIDKSSLALSFVIATNQPSRLPLSTLRVQNRLNHITPYDLALDVREIDEILGPKQPAKAAIVAHALTDGWPAAIHLMCHDPQIMDALAHDRLNPENPPLSESVEAFLNERVFSKMSNELKNLLVNMSALSQFTASQAEYICEQEGVGVLLHDHNYDPFIQSIGREEIMYEFNPYFRQFLRRRLDRFGQRHINQIHYRATQWLERYASPIHAIVFALTTGDIKTGIDLFNRLGGVEIGFRYGTETLRNILDHIPTEVAEKDPQANLSQAFLHMKECRLDLARHFLQFAEAQLANQPACSALNYFTSITTLMISIYEDREIDLSTINIFNSESNLPKSEGYWAQGWQNGISAMVHYTHYDLAKAEQCVLLSCGLFNAAQSKFSEAYMQMLHGVVNLAKARPSAAQKNFIVTQELCRDAAWATGINVLNDVLYAGACFDSGHFDESKTYIKRSLDIMHEHDLWTEGLLLAYMTAIKLALVHGSTSEALKHCDTCSDIAKKFSLRRLSDTMDAVRIELAAFNGDIRYASALVKDWQADKPIKSIDAVAGREIQTYYYYTLGLSRVYLAQREEKLAIKILEPAIKRQIKEGHTHFYLRFTILNIIALSSLGQNDQADQLFFNLAQMPHYRQNKGLFLLEGARLGLYLQRLIKRDILKDLDPEVISFIGNLIADLEKSIETFDGGGIMSRQETKVLHLLEDGHANKVIARELNISDATVKYHLRNIYQKLGVNSRLMAVKIARAKGILAKADE
jgi:LuxR family maltose regulon positive regulatory protein